MLQTQSTSLKISIIHCRKMAKQIFVLICILCSLNIIFAAPLPANDPDDSKRDEILLDFMTQSGANKARARSYLEKANWDLKTALSDLAADVFGSKRKNDSESTQSPDPSGLPDSTQNTGATIMRLWRQGFTLDDNELRLYEEPQNQDFMAWVTRGQVPPELLRKGIFQLRMEDRRGEYYKEYPSWLPKKPFHGKGQTCGSDDETILQAPNEKMPQASNAAGTENKANEKLAAEKLNVDASQPTTSIRIRLADGTKLTGRFNLSHTVNDIRTFIKNARPQYAASEFSLLTPFPSNELTDSEQTIEEAELSNSTIMQRLN